MGLYRIKGTNIEVDIVRQGVGVARCRYADGFEREVLMTALEAIPAQPKAPSVVPPTQPLADWDASDFSLQFAGGFPHEAGAGCEICDALRAQKARAEADSYSPPWTIRAQRGAPTTAAPFASAVASFRLAVEQPGHTTPCPHAGDCGCCPHAFCAAHAPPPPIEQRVAALEAFLAPCPGFHRVHVFDWPNENVCRDCGVRRPEVRR